MSEFFAKLGMLSDRKLDWKCSNCKRKFKAKCNAASHIAQSSCKRMSATVLFIGVANELLRAQPIIEADETIELDRALCEFKKMSTCRNFEMDHFRWTTTYVKIKNVSPVPTPR